MVSATWSGTNKVQTDEGAVSGTVSRFILVELVLPTK